ncbi:hypothetical protein Prudu_004646 [Prunus dulcis]|uniref:Uncharacterized protein n=1 Tax=Prunus dulcis TaxID=3755 RepID=A0A4Y1QVT2_PRUDU|nr:hypothetical protein Prudu_004646 [Prunus dulcis]
MSEYEDLPMKANQGLMYPSKPFTTHAPWGDSKDFGMFERMQLFLSMCSGMTEEASAQSMGNRRSTCCCMPNQILFQGL